MQVFKIAGKFEQNSKWRELTGYFVKLDDDDVIEGYVDAQTDTSTVSVRPIKGVYTKGGRLTFLQEEVNSMPSCYDFINANEQVSPFTYYTSAQARTTLYSYTFRECNEGFAQMRLEEIVVEDKKMELARKIATLHNRNSHANSDTGLASKYMMKNFKDVITVFVEHYCD